MNIHCEWYRGNDEIALIIFSGIKPIGYVNDDGGEPVLTFKDFSNPSLTFSEIEHIMDNFYNLPKDC